MHFINLLGATCVLFFATWKTSSAADMCGVEKPDQTKTCVSVRLPWQMEPIYFCKDKEAFKYRNHCSHSSMMHCGNEYSEGTLMVATPWDCCPMMSVPDACMQNECPQKPLNRECEPLPSKYDECCPRYFCEPGMTPDKCHVKRLEPGCVMPPKDKMNCVGFQDPYGCCIKYQCEGEGKPGMCPAQMHAMRLKERLNSTVTMLHPKPTERDGEVAPEPQPEPSNVDQTVMDLNGKIISKKLKVSGGSMHYSNEGDGHHNMMTYSTMYSGEMFFQMQCIGDSNCPDDLKCCSAEINSYGDGMYVMKSSIPVYGVCMKPVMMKN